MKFKLILLLLCLITPSVWASEARFTFDPNDLIDLYTAGNPGGQGLGSQANPRIILGDGYVINSNMAATYSDHPDRGSRWIGDDAHYADWREGLGDGEGIRQFNMWITTSNYPYGSYLRTDYGEQLFRNGMYNNDAYGLSGTAVDGWTAEVDVVLDGDGGVSYGVVWSTTNSAAYLRPGGADLGEFSFTLKDVAGYRGLPEEIIEGQDYKVWFGSDQLVFDDQGWGTNSTQAAFSNNGAHWEAELYVPAELVPEPASVLLLALGSGLSVFIRRLKAFYGRH